MTLSIPGVWASVWAQEVQEPASRALRVLPRQDESWSQVPLSALAADPKRARVRSRPLHRDVN